MATRICDILDYETDIAPYCVWFIFDKNNLKVTKIYEKTLEKIQVLFYSYALFFNYNWLSEKCYVSLYIYAKCFTKKIFCAIILPNCSCY